MTKTTGLKLAYRAAAPCLVLAVAACGGDDFAGTLAASDKFISHPLAIANEYIVVLETAANTALTLGSTTARDEVRAEAQRLTWAHAGDVQHTYEHAMAGFVAHLSDVEARLMSQRPEVAYVEENGIVRLSATQDNPPWGLDRIDQVGVSLDLKYRFPGTGAGVTAYIIDTGIRASHQDFGGVQSRVTDGFNIIKDSNGTDDCHGHGTHVAGTVGGAEHGVAKGVTLIPVRVLGCNGSGTYAGVIEGVEYVTGHAKDSAPGPVVANMSLGGGASKALDDAVAASITSGVTYVVAAGNGNADACNTSPARTQTAITVGASTIKDTRASFSNFGPCVDLFAPGFQIKSAYKTNDTSTALLSGTSMASPHVAGAAALYLERFPATRPKDVSKVLVNSGLSGILSDLNEQTANVLLQTDFTPSSVVPASGEHSQTRVENE